MKELKSFIVLYDGEFIRAYHEAEVDEAIAAKDAEIAAKDAEIATLRTIPKQIYEHAQKTIAKLKEQVALLQAEFVPQERSRAND